MRNRCSATAIFVLLVATSIRPADARPVNSSDHLAACGARVMGSSEAQDWRSSCMIRVVAHKARVSRSAHPRRLSSSHNGASCGGTLSVVRARSGATACIASRAAGSFQAFVTALENTGYHIDFMGGWRAHGSCRQCNMHPRGLALDINQTGRNRVTHALPSGVTALAAQFGLLHGAVWEHADTGHFELLSESPTRYAYASYTSADRVARRVVRHRVAALRVGRAVMLTQGSFMQGSGSH